MMIIDLTPFSPHSSTTGGMSLAGMATTARSIVVRYLLDGSVYLQSEYLRLPED